MGTFSRRILLALLLTLGTLCTVRAADRSAPLVYTALYPPDTQALQPAQVQSALGTALEGRSILFLGDSLTAGYGLDSYDDTWCAMLGSKYGMDVTCRSVNGSTIAAAAQEVYGEGGCYSPIVRRELPEGDYDVIFVEGGYNDWYCAIPLGDTTDSRDPNCFQGAINLLIDRIQAAYPQSLLVFMTGWEPKDRPASDYTPEGDYHEAMTRVCAARGIPCFQACDPEISGIYANSENFRSKYFLTSSDGCHLNPAGQALFLPTIAQWLIQQVEENFLVQGFYDVTKKDWFADSVDFAAARGYMVGTEAHLFSPEEDTTRGMLVTLLYRAAGKPSVEGLTTPFTDVPADEYYADAVVWAYDRGYVLGTDAAHFDPEASITRQQITAILHRMAVGREEAAPEALPEALRDYSDADLVEPYARTPMAWAVEAGLLRGTDNHALDPSGSAIRAQVATLLQRYLRQFSIS